jgi:hypothetical protein
MAIATAFEFADQDPLVPLITAGFASSDVEGQRGQPRRSQQLASFCKSAFCENWLRFAKPLQMYNYKLIFIADTRNGHIAKN